MSVRSCSVAQGGWLTIDQVSSAVEVVLALESRADLLSYPYGSVVVGVYQWEEVRDAQRAEGVVAYCLSDFSGVALFHTLGFKIHPTSTPG
jgi:hypothetical protein